MTAMGSRMPMPATTSACPTSSGSRQAARNPPERRMVGAHLRELPDDPDAREHHSGEAHLSQRGRRHELPKPLHAVSIGRPARTR
jgi:hypothetical protein